jgi:hypothetical protein
MQWGGYQYKWTSAHVLVPLILGILLIIGFFAWEAYGAKYPMFPARLKQESRIFTLTLIITAISGANFFSILMFWPSIRFPCPFPIELKADSCIAQAFNVSESVMISHRCSVMFRYTATIPLE